MEDLLNLFGTALVFVNRSTHLSLPSQMSDPDMRWPSVRINLLSKTISYVTQYCGWHPLQCTRWCRGKWYIWIIWTPRLRVYIGSAWSIRMGMEDSARNDATSRPLWVLCKDGTTRHHCAHNGDYKADSDALASECALHDEICRGLHRHEEWSSRVRGYQFMLKWSPRKSSLSEQSLPSKHCDGAVFLCVVLR